MIRAVFPCFGSTRQRKTPETSGCCHQTPDEREEQLAAGIYGILVTAEKPGAALRAQVDGLVHADSWSEKLAERLLDHIIANLVPEKMGPAMRDAYEKAETAAREFVSEHPVFVEVMATVVAIGILALLVPWVVEALGFGELGPIAGSFAARWQSTFPNVEARSFFAFLQRLGMRWGKR
ncbi:hypothetical protein K431DRAFT_220646 [Polychaeton citri CBS 116435]|uniref:Uncharacterized protein n=1 Tax=Polychaeton citri CBS 116435 TaxID=1314669 RepID=A0A9P4QE51_9PEZI|nr:hypothetical protein K431DRAFT_220646 [Polychaeton citri CBS 116435]